MCHNVGLSMHWLEQGMMQIWSGHQHLAAGAMSAVAVASLSGNLYNGGVCVQLAIDNVLPPYLGNQFGYSTVKAANFAAIFGLMNFWARPLGGYLSDLTGRRYGTCP